MDRKAKIHGFEAVASGAIAANCDVYPGCPTSLNDKFFESLAKEFSKKEKHFIRVSSDVCAINTAFGSASAGGRSMILVSGEGWGSIQEQMSNCVNGYVPMVVVLIQRGGPGVGSSCPAQMDYIPMTRGAGQGNYRMIVLAPHSVQEIYELIQLAFHLSDKWRNPVIVATDEIIGLSEEEVEFKTLEFDPLPDKTWAVRGKKHHNDGMRRCICIGQGFMPTPDFPTYYHLLKGLNEKILDMKENEPRYEVYNIDDAEIVLVAYGYTSRICLEAINIARSQGIKAGLVRPITLWPFPYEPLRKKASDNSKFLVIEDGFEGLVEDVIYAVRDKEKVRSISILDRDRSNGIDAITPQKVLKHIDELINRR